MNQQPSDKHQLSKQIKAWGYELGFQQVGIADIDLSSQEPKFLEWLQNGFHGEMSYMAAHGTKRTRPDELLPGTLAVVSVRMDYLPQSAKFATDLEASETGYISRYALGRDYHKVIRKKLKQLANKIESIYPMENATFRPFVDSAPVLERPLAEKAGLGWVGKHSLLIDAKAGSWFFLGELFLPFQLESDEPEKEQCGNCVACITTCPTQAIVAPYIVDSRKCISYLTIEYAGIIPEEYRQAIGNRIYGCDDCQLICHWNRQAEITTEKDFTPREQLQSKSLTQLWSWSESEFLQYTEGSAIRRIGYERWQRNIAIALGNSPFSLTVTSLLENNLGKVSELVDHHIHWAIQQQHDKAEQQGIENRRLQRLIKAIKVGLPRDA